MGGVIELRKTPDQDADSLARTEIRRFRLPRSRRRQTTPLELVDKNDVRDDLLRVVLGQTAGASCSSFTVQKASSLFNIFVDFSNHFVWYQRRGVRIWGSRPYRRPAPVLACRCTP